MKFNFLFDNFDTTKFSTNPPPSNSLGYGILIHVLAPKSLDTRCFFNLKSHVTFVPLFVLVDLLFSELNLRLLSLPFLITCLHLMMLRIKNEGHKSLTPLFYLYIGLQSHHKLKL